jgi:hypothetical protein
VIFLIKSHHIPNLKVIYESTPIRLILPYFK